MSSLTFEITLPDEQPTQSGVVAADSMPINANDYGSWMSVMHLKPQDIVDVLLHKNVDVREALDGLFAEGKIKNTRTLVKSNLEKVWKGSKIGGAVVNGRNSKL
jgi:hypothetical protein